MQICYAPVSNIESEALVRAASRGMSLMTLTCRMCERKTENGEFC